MTTKTFDVAIVGGAAVGSSVAYFLTHDLGFTGSVAVVERDPTYAQAATTLSAGSIRPQLSTPEDIPTEGADIVLLGPNAMAATFPWLNIADLALGAFGRTGEGWFDAHSLLTLMRTAARRKGAHYIHGEDTGIACERGRITGVTLANGERIACGTLVNAAGPHAGDVAALLGRALPGGPRQPSGVV